MEETNSLCYRIVETVAANSNTPVTDLPPLFEAVDTDALEALFSPSPDDPSRFEGTVTFPYAGWRITVSADGSVTVDSLAEPPEQEE